MVACLDAMKMSAVVVCLTSTFLITLLLFFLWGCVFYRGVESHPCLPFKRCDSKLLGDSALIGSVPIKIQSVGTY